MRNLRMTIWVIVSTVLTITFVSSGDIIYDNEADFLLSAPIVNVESFETLPVDSSVAQHSFLTLPDFTIMEQASTLSVHDVPNLGLIATDGDKYVRNTDGLAMTITFNNPQTAFGINIIDWGDNGNGILTFSNNIGDTFQIASGAQPSGTILFFGITTSQHFTEVVLSQTLISDSWAVDEVYYEPSLSPVEQIEMIIADKLDLIEQINVVLEKEHQVIESLAEDDLTKAARLKINSAIHEQDKAIKALEKSIESLEDSLLLLEGL